MPFSSLENRQNSGSLEGGRSRSDVQPLSATEAGESKSCLVVPFIRLEKRILTTACGAQALNRHPELVFFVVFEAIKLAVFINRIYHRNRANFDALPVSSTTNEQRPKSFRVGAV